jgi:hypothetical protein
MPDSSSLNFLAPLQHQFHLPSEIFVVLLICDFSPSVFTELLLLLYRTVAYFSSFSIFLFLSKSLLDVTCAYSTGLCVPTVPVCVCLEYRSVCTYSTGLCVPTVPVCVCLQYLSVCAYCTVLCVPTVPVCVCLQYRSVCAYSTVLCVPTVPFCVCVLYRSVCAYSTGLCVPTVPVCVCLLYRSVCAYGTDLLHDFCKVYRQIIPSVFLSYNLCFHYSFSVFSLRDLLL